MYSDEYDDEEDEPLSHEESKPLSVANAFGLVFTTLENTKSIIIPSIK